MLAQLDSATEALVLLLLSATWGSYLYLNNWMVDLTAQCPMPILKFNKKISRVVLDIVYDSSSLKHEKPTTVVPFLNLTALWVKRHRFSYLLPRRCFVFSYYCYFTKQHYCFVIVGSTLFVNSVSSVRVTAASLLVI